MNKAKEEAEDYGGGSVNQSQELAAHQAFVEFDLDSTDNDDDEVESQPNNLSSFQSSEYTASKASSSGRANAWIDSCSLENAKMKLISILKGEAVIPKQRWGVDKILATLVQHREDPRLRTSYRQFKRFAYQTMLEELDDSKRRWSTALKRKDWDLIIELRAKFEIEKRYNQEIQRLCQTECF